MNNAEYRAFTNYAQELSKLQIENVMLEKENEALKDAIDKIQGIIEDIEHERF